MLAPSRPRPTVAMPTMAPVRKPIVHGRLAALARWRRRPPAGWRGRRATCRGSRSTPEKPAPTRKNSERQIRTADVVGRQRQQHEERDDGEDAERAELAGQVGVGALLDGQGDVLHVVGALTGGEHLVRGTPRPSPSAPSAITATTTTSNEVAPGEVDFHDSGNGSRSCDSSWSDRGVTSQSLTDVRESTHGRGPHATGHTGVTSTHSGWARRVSRAARPRTRLSRGSRRPWPDR